MVVAAAVAVARATIRGVRGFTRALLPRPWGCGQARCPVDDGPHLDLSTDARHRPRSPNQGKPLHRATRCFAPVNPPKVDNVRRSNTALTGPVHSRPNVAAMTDRTVAAHALRRLTFGPTSAEVDAAVTAGLEATVPRLLRPPPVPAAPDLGADPLGALPPGAGRADKIKARQAVARQVPALAWWWFTRMTSPANAAEKLTFFWHGHWATSVQKVRSATLMLAQQQTFRRYGTGDTGPLVRAMLRDPALIVWLDGQKNTRKAPNENLARELMELFTLGVGHYTEDDVKAGARVLTGWQVNRATGTATLLPRRHDG